MRSRYTINTDSVGAGGNSIEFGAATVRERSLTLALTRNGPLPHGRGSRSFVTRARHGPLRSCLLEHQVGFEGVVRRRMAAQVFRMLVLAGGGLLRNHLRPRILFPPRLSLGGGRLARGSFSGRVGAGPLRVAVVVFGRILLRRMFLIRRNDPLEL